jgi:hypothetical protein
LVFSNVYLKQQNIATDEWEVEYLKGEVIEFCRRVLLLIFHRQGQGQGKKHAFGYQ